MHSIEDCLVVLSKEKDTLGTLEGISEARIARHELPSGLMARMKVSVKTWEAGSWLRALGQAFQLTLGIT